MVKLSEWEEIEAEIVANIKANVNIASHSATGISFSYFDLESQKQFLIYVRNNIAGLKPKNRNFSKVRFID